ncbi:hypothetical protein [Rhodopila globiformis]|uniref:PepSY domain-containing protein n=1 Tax=Rhodopila globiformis TaxID=1071 RepID=A0A2S6N392_RHOGL|nr:hypothetical protein [Rhodopila globiformis]PPQ29062.1 hypothetical protein CCS01_22780 [Rhodopila globiformis]
MRQTILAAALAFVIGGAATGAVLSQAQPAPPAPPPGMPMGMMQGHGPQGMMGMMQGHGPQGMMGCMHHPEHEGWLHHMRDFALVYRHPDRQLSAADVQKIAEAFLLWNGNHTWKVTDVAATANGPIAFSIATPEGSVVAKFTMDPHTGHLARVG